MGNIMLLLINFILIEMKSIFIFIEIVGKNTIDKKCKVVK